MLVLRFVTLVLRLVLRLDEVLLRLVMLLPLVPTNKLVVELLLLFVLFAFDGVPEGIRPLAVVRTVPDRF